MSRLDKAKTVAEIVQIGSEILHAYLERRDEQKGKAARVRELEAELARLRKGKK